MDSVFGRGFRRCDIEVMILKMNYPFLKMWQLLNVWLELSFDLTSFKGSDGTDRRLRKKYKVLISNKNFSSSRGLLTQNEWDEPVYPPPTQLSPWKRWWYVFTPNLKGLSPSWAKAWRSLTSRGSEGVFREEVGSHTPRARPRRRVTTLSTQLLFSPTLGSGTPGATSCG